MSETPRIAPPGMVHVCCACGKRSRDLYGDKGTSWDESCMLNAVLAHESHLVLDGSRVIQIKDGGLVKEPKP